MRNLQGGGTGWSAKHHSASMSRVAATLRYRRRFPTTPTPSHVTDPEIQVWSRRRVRSTKPGTNGGIVAWRDVRAQRRRPRSRGVSRQGATGFPLATQWRQAVADAQALLRRFRHRREYLFRRGLVGPGRRRANLRSRHVQQERGPPESFAGTVFRLPAEG